MDEGRTRLELTLLDETRQRIEALFEKYPEKRGALLPAMIGGSVIIESIFSIPGMGRLSFEAILARDYPMIMGILSFTAVLTLIGLVVSDILYAMVDPRIKLK